MSAIDWRGIDWWDLPGPAAFLRDTANRIAAEASGIVSLSLPSRRPKRLFESLTTHLEQEVGLRVVLVNVNTLDPAASPAHALATAAGAQPGEIRSTADFVAGSDLADILFIVDAIPPDRWSTWSLFLRAFRSERERTSRLSAPQLAVVPPDNLPPDEASAALGASTIRWIGVVSRSDMQLYVEMRLGPSDNLIRRTAVATITEAACWDPDMADLLIAQPVLDQLNPWHLLTNSGVGNLGIPSWANGLVNLWDGDPHLHTLTLVGDGPGELLARRIWRAHVGTIFPAVELVRQAFVRRFSSTLQALLPFEKQFNQTVRVYNDPMELEINDVAYHLRPHLSRDEQNLLYNFKHLRTAMAHMEPANPRLIIAASESWAKFVRSASFDDGSLGWDWPRCGQQLVLLIGPSGAGKSTYAAKTYLAEEIISSDAIREELFGSNDMAGSQERVFETLRARVKGRLAAGRSAVVDATNLHQRDRLANALIAPVDIAVEYVVIDRPAEEKHRDAGWRATKPNLIDNHSQLFARELAEILAGDHLPNVCVCDLRREQGQVLAS